MSIKNRMIDLHNELYNIPLGNDSVVCKICLQDRHLIGALSSRFYDDRCSFCNLDGEVADVEYLFDEIVKAVKEDKWEKCIDCVPYDGGEMVFDGTDLREVVLDLCDEVNILNPALQQFMFECFSDELMIHRFYEQDYNDEEYLMNWNTFKKNIQNKQRYTSFLGVNCEHVYHFKKLMKFISKNNVLELKESDCVFRGRSADILVSKVESFGPPPIEKTKNTRMTPKGISCLYCSSNIETVKYELFDNNKSIHIRRVKPIKHMNLVDLSDIRLPSPFDRKHRGYRGGLRFMKEFAKEISKPINIDDKEHLEYIPTQVIFEYIRCFTNNKFDGIRYRSSKSDDGFNYAFFCDEAGFAKMFNVCSREYSATGRER